MTRLRLVLLLALALWPSSAAASPGAPTGGGPDEVQAQDGEYGRHALRSTSSPRLVAGLEVQRHGGGRVPLHRLPDPARPASSAGCRAPRHADRDARSVPLCERLPYHATAPPSPR